ncbi:MAG: hypothetical protein DME50_14610 [Verrucomicrobia bacterium]|nr:MAG: hypothetical protein DME85_05325 [Verrucomicrobiota bacterium]PYK64262.1 MAG: hypothetical protein DME50_14610 [Verrucomicrobiota bacterium]
MRKGRFSKPAAEVAQRYSESVSFDWRLYQYDIAGSIAHAAALWRRSSAGGRSCRGARRSERLAFDQTPLQRLPLKTAATTLPG